jgi:coenzyme F420-reducing hydrogenase beta subunit
MTLTAGPQTALGAVDVAAKGYCIGCGACTSVSASARVSFNEFGELVAVFADDAPAESAKLDAVCPFSSSAPSESELAAREFEGVSGIRLGAEVGFFNGLYAGYSHAHRGAGSSGGIVTWLLGKLLEVGAVDKVIVVGRSAGEQRFYDFKVVERAHDLPSAATSFYYPVSYDRVLKYVRENPGRYAITGVPCFHKALRQLKREDPLLRDRIVYQIGIVCGQMKSAFYLEYLSRRAGLPGAPEQACFRRKNPRARADNYDFEAQTTLASGEQVIRRVANSEIGANWGMGLFKPKACDFCDDVFAETADIAVMDAWLPQYVQDGLGTSLVVTRAPELQRLFETELANPAELWLSPVSERDVMESQRGGLNHRRAGLRYRLALIPDGEAAPVKRVRAHKRFGFFFKIEQWLRARLRTASRDAMKAQLQSGQPGLAIYDARMRRDLQAYRWLYRIKSRLGRPVDHQHEFRLDT